MVRAFLSIITIIYHPSSIIHHHFCHDKYWSKENDSAITSSGIRAFCARPFFFFLTFNTFLHFCLFCFCATDFQYLVLPVFAYSQRDRTSDVVPFFRFLYENTFSVMEF